MARQLVLSLTADFDPEKYHDEYREELLALIDRKAAGEEIVAAPETEEPAKVLDLMAALEASLERAGRQAGEGRSRARGEGSGPRREAVEARRAGEEGRGEEGVGEEGHRQANPEDRLSPAVAGRFPPSPPTDVPDRTVSR